mmetsp:Transcript_32847/g.51352  ORF Transcript_32847/g.51352 Transcript_32847/m.51352 type:complete len:80 (+) Transcript_32847:357-596(+)
MLPGSQNSSVSTILRQWRSFLAASKELVTACIRLERRVRLDEGLFCTVSPFNVYFMCDGEDRSISKHTRSWMQERKEHV